MQLTVFSYDKNATLLVARYENLPNMLLKSTLVCENHMIRQEILKRLKDIIKQMSGKPEINDIIKIVGILVFKIHQESAKHD